MKGNEHADKYAKELALSKESDITHDPYTDILSCIKKEAYTNTTNLIKAQSFSTVKSYLSLFYEDSSMPWFKHKNLSKQFTVTINRIRANHYNLASSLFKINVTNDPKCKCGSDTEDINHLIWQCELYNEQRIKLSKDLLSLNLFPPYNIIL